MENETNNLLVPALQKFYSALRHLDNFKKNQDLFDNISCLDSFISEYRNVTFVIQKSLAHTEWIGVYEQLRDEFLINDVGRWMTEKRNEVLKEHPFQLEKILRISIYSPEFVTVINTKAFTIEDYMDFGSIKDPLKAFLLETKHLEVYFSVEYVFREKGYDGNIFDKILKSIPMMKKFLCKLNDTVKDESTIYKELSDRIEKLNIAWVTKSALLIDDYVYHVSTDSFEKGNRLETGPLPARGHLSMLDKFTYHQELLDLSNNDAIMNYFVKFAFLHTDIFVRQGKHILPTFFIIFNDDSLEIRSFDSSIRTTTYRIINDTASRIKNKRDVKAVFLIHEMWMYSSLDVLKMTYEERVEKGNPSALLAAHLIDNTPRECYFNFKAEHVEDSEYVLDVIRKGAVAAQPGSFLNPILNAFVNYPSAVSQ